MSVFALPVAHAQISASMRERIRNPPVYEPTASDEAKITQKMMSSPVYTTPMMGFDTKEAFGKLASEWIVKNTMTLMKDTGLFQAGYRAMVLGDGWMQINSNWIARDNYATRPNLVGQSKTDPGCMRSDGVRFPSGIKNLGNIIKSQGFYFGLYTSGTQGACLDSSVGYFSGGLEATDAKCFDKWRVDLINIEACSPGTIPETVMRTWRSLLPKRIGIHNMRFGCTAPVACGSIYKCPFQVVLANNQKIMPYCTETSKMARVSAVDMKPDWFSIVANMQAMKGRGLISRPGFWSNPDVLLSSTKLLTLNEIQSQFAVWCTVSAPLMLSVNMTQMTDEVLRIITNVDAIRVDQTYDGDAGDVFYEYGAIWGFKKRLSQEETAIVIVNIGENLPGLMFTPGPVGGKIEWTVTDLKNLAPDAFNGKSPRMCQARVVFDQLDRDIAIGDTFLLAERQSVMFIVSNCS